MNILPDTTPDTLVSTRTYSWSSILRRIVLLGALFLVICAGIAYLVLYQILEPAPATFPVYVPVIVEEGMSARAVTKLLADRGYVRSELALYLELVLQHDPSTIKASTYVFDTPLTTSEIASELTEGRFTDDLIRFVHIEGERADHIAAKAAPLSTKFSPADFIVIASPHEGKLFPDTYFLSPDFTAEDLLETLLATFDERSAPLREQIAAHSLSLPEILILASIIEREANTPESMRRVSGILQQRLEIGMPLQVDASIEPVLNKPLQELTPSDLKQDTPYNTYLNAGLPPTPIGNPGIQSITAVLEPIRTDDLFYITGTDGEFYYAETFDQHRLNIARHLR